MNIFYLDKCPKKSAEYMYNKHIVKMILESAQMLCCAHYHYNTDTEQIPYKKTHYNHPSTKWVRECASHYSWLYEHMRALGDEYTKRYNKTHLSITKCKHLWKLPNNIPRTEFKQPPQAMPDKYKDKCSITAYWNYYIAEKSNIANKNETIYKQKP